MPRPKTKTPSSRTRGELGPGSVRPATLSKIPENKQFSKESLRAFPDDGGSVVNVLEKNATEKIFLSLENIIRGRNSTNCEMMRQPRRGLRNAAATFWHLRSVVQKGRVLPIEIEEMAAASEWGQFLDACQILKEANIAFDPSYAPQVINNFTHFLTTDVAAKEQVFGAAAQVASRAYLFSMHFLEQMALLNNRQEWCAKIKPKISPPHPWLLNPSSGSLMELYLAATMSRPVSSPEPGRDRVLADLLHVEDSDAGSGGRTQAAPSRADRQGGKNPAGTDARGHLAMKARRERYPRGGSRASGDADAQSGARSEDAGDSPPRGHGYIRASERRRRPQRPDPFPSGGRHRSGRAGDRAPRKSGRAGRSGRRGSGRANRSTSPQESTSPSRRRAARHRKYARETSLKRRGQRAAEKWAPRAHSPWGERGLSPKTGRGAVRGGRRESDSRETSSASAALPGLQRRAVAQRLSDESEESARRFKDPPPPPPPDSKKRGDKKYDKKGGGGGRPRGRRRSAQSAR